VVQVTCNGGTGLVQGCGLPIRRLRTFETALDEEGLGRLVLRPLPLQQFTLDDAFASASRARTGTRQVWSPCSLNRVRLLRVPC